MQTFDQAMTQGRAEYQDVIDALGRAGYPATFTQTGGMNAALEVMLDGGWALLITDARDALSWERVDQRGWGVGLFTPEERYWAAPQAFAEDPATDIATLLSLVQQVLRTAVQRGPSSCDRRHDCHGCAARGPTCKASPVLNRALCLVVSCRDLPRQTHGIA